MKPDELQELLERVDPRTPLVAQLTDLLRRVRWDRASGQGRW